MSRLLSILAGLLSVLLVPLALSGPTALLVPVAHLAFSLSVCTGAMLDGLDGWPERARRWGFVYLVATAAAVAALQLGADVRHQGAWYWGVPWVSILAWGWIPPLVSGLAGSLGVARARRLTRRVVVHRRRN
jgi:hypothetical protein